MDHQISQASLEDQDFIRITLAGRSPLFVLSETLYHRDDALLYIAFVMLIWAAPISADRWHCSLWPSLTPWVDWHAP